MNREFLMVREIKTVGNETIASSEIIKNTNTFLGESFLFGIIPKRNSLFIGTSGLKNFLKEQYPRIYSLDISIHDRVLTLHFEERRVHSLWCVLKEYTDPFQEECYFADQRGFWYERSPYFSDNVFRKVYLDPSVDSIIEEKKFDDKEFIDSFFIFLDGLEHDFELSIGAIYLMPQGDIVLGIDRFRNERFIHRPIIIFNREDSYERISRDLGVVLNERDFNENWEQFPNQLQSIDIRFSDRVFYRFSEFSEMKNYSPLGKHYEAKSTDEQEPIEI